MLRRRALAACLLTCIALPVMPTSADDPADHAGLGPSVGTAQVTTTSDGVVSTVTSWQSEPGQPGSGRGRKEGRRGTHPTPPCRFLLDDGYSPPEGEPDPHAGQAGAWYLKICGPQVASTAPLTQLVTWADTTVELVWLPQREAPVVRTSPRDLAAQAARFLPLPRPRVQHNPRPAIVNLPTWLWIDHTSWGTRRSVAAVPGLAVTVTATPTSVMWNLDPEEPDLQCDGAGRVYDTALSAAQQTSDCTFRYRRSSATQPARAFAATATTTWAIRWQAAPGGTGQLPALQRTTSFAMPVREVQTVLTRSQ